MLYSNQTIPMEIVKADGTREPFKPAKLVASLRRAGAQKEEISQIVEEIKITIEDGMSTQEIYKRAFQLLRESDNPTAAKYSLRRAIFGLGPTGFPFEDFLSRVFEAEGYKTMRRVTLSGKCADHEIDIAAYSESDSFVAEAKFHSRPGIRSDLQVAMYSYARFLDLKSQHVCREDVCGIINLYVITNTKFTRSAQKYAECTGINLLSWNYPKNNNLQRRIEKLGLYPVTVLTHLNNNQKQQLLEKGVILCSEIVRKPHHLRALSLSGKKFDAVMHEAMCLCGS